MWLFLAVETALVAAWMLAATVEDVLLERGILGVIALVLGTFAWQTIKQLRKDLTDCQQRERDLQKEVYTKVLPLIERTAAAADARTDLDRSMLETWKDVRRILDRIDK